MRAKLICILLVLSACLLADSFLYDASGERCFLKLYLQPDRSSHSLIDYPVLVDAQGEFYAVMIKFKHWICPFCGTLNPEDTEKCISKNCPLVP